jgi:hypothetical protein
MLCVAVESKGDSTKNLEKNEEKQGRVTYPQDDYFLINMVGEPRAKVDILTKRMLWIIEHKQNWHTLLTNEDHQKAFDLFFASFYKRVTCSEPWPLKLKPEMESPILVKVVRDVLAWLDKECRTEELTKIKQGKILDRDLRQQHVKITFLVHLRE